MTDAVDVPTTSMSMDASFPRHHAGSEWLANHLRRRRIALRPLGRRVADVLGEAAHGLYHIVRAVDSPRTDWTNRYCIEICYEPGYHGLDLCTVDGDGLTRLVLLCHDAGLRLSISPRTFRAVTLEFWPRESRTGAISQRYGAGGPPGALSPAGGDTVMPHSRGSSHPASGRVKKNVAPAPGVLSTHRRPPWRSTIFLHTARPIPVPS